MLKEKIDPPWKENTIILTSNHNFLKQLISQLENFNNFKPNWPIFRGLCLRLNKDKGFVEVINDLHQNLSNSHLHQNFLNIQVGSVAWTYDLLIIHSINFCR